VFTTNKHVHDDLSKTGIKVVFLPELATLGTVGDADVGPKLRRYFLQAWLSFVVANSLNKVMWQTPGTIWVDRPDNIVNAHPIVESLWAYKGRKEKRSAPFFISFDFFTALGVERPIHLLHEIILHFDLVIAWDSLDAVASYRLSENNSRYGTTTHVMAPYKVLHVDLMDWDPAKLRQAMTSKEPPQAVVVPKDFADPAKAKKLLSEAGLWYI
jgi:hypothetical protein